jgi:uncharacterized protein with GYD domain
MPTYIALIRSTQPGIENIKESPARLDAAKKAFRAMGGELKQWYPVMGRYDAVVFAEALDDEPITKLAFAIASQGSVRVESLRAF